MSKPIGSVLKEEDLIADADILPAYARELGMRVYLKDIERFAENDAQVPAEKYRFPSPVTIFRVYEREKINEDLYGLQIEEVGYRYDNFNISEEARREAMNIIAIDYHNRDLDKIPLIGLRKLANVLNVDYNNSFLQRDFVREIGLRLAL